MSEELILPEGDWAEIKLYWINGMGWITEREWREMMYRVKESPRPAGGKDND